jgi:signal transduction histidine kinase
VEPRSGTARRGTVLGPQPAERARLRLIGITLWLALAAGSIVLAKAAGPRGPVLPYVAVAGLAAAGAVGLVAYAQLASAPPGLRTLRILAVLLPTLFIVCIEAILLIIEADELFTEVGEHIVATAVLSLSAVPFSIWVFGRFEALRNELARRAERLERLHAASLAVTADPTAPRLLEAIVRGARAVVSADRAVLLLQAPAGGTARSVADPPDGASEGTEASPAPAADGARTLVSRMGRADGGEQTLAVERHEGPPFTAEDALLLDMYAVAAAAAVQNAERLEEAQRLATVEERERIARDLHDDLGQLLGFLTAKVQAARELVAAGRPAQASTELTELESAARELSAQVREAILGLRTSVRPDRPLARAIEEYAVELGIQAGLRIELDVPPDAGARLPGPARYQALRIVQEALSNVRRHASAQRVALSLCERDGVLEIVVRDDGKGFDPAAAGHSGRFGLKTMRERAQSLGGTFEVRSAPGEGTTVTARIPLAPEA